VNASPITLTTALGLVSAGISLCDQLERNAASSEVELDARPLIHFAIDETGPHLTVRWPLALAATLTAVKWPGFEVPKGLTAAVSDDFLQLILRPADKPALPPELARALDAAMGRIDRSLST